MTVIPADKIELAKRFAAGRIGAVQRNRGPETCFQPCWHPRVAGRNVRNADTPGDGYNTRDEAIEAAKRYRASCRNALAAQSAANQ